MYRNKRSFLKVKKFFMCTILFIAIAGIGACIYKMYADINVVPKELVSVQVQKVSTQTDITNEKTISNIIEDIIPTVVGISKIKDSGNSIFLKESVTKLGLGTGVIVSENGYIVTNQHVVGNKYSSCYITLENGKTYTGNVTWADMDLDLAIVKINARGLDYIELGDSSRAQNYR